MRDLEYILKRITAEGRNLDRELNRIPKGKRIFREELLLNLEKVSTSHDLNRLESLLLAAEQDGLDTQYLKIFCQLIEETWHGFHEDLVTLIGAIGYNEGIPCIVRAISLEEDLQDDVPAPITKKAIWALGEIGTDEAKREIEKLCLSSNRLVVETAQLQLERFN